MKAATFLLAGAALLLSACSSNSDDNEPPQQATAAHIQPRVVMSSLAESTCSNAGGPLAFSHQLVGPRVGRCQLVNGRRCDAQRVVCVNSPP